MSLNTIDPGTFETTNLATIRTNVKDKTVSENNLLAYVPYYYSHGGQNAAGFINLEGVFPCIANRGEGARCRKFTWEEDGANHGYHIVVISDRGNSLNVFGDNVETLGFTMANPDCKEIDTSQTSGCFPRWTAFTILCYLPSKFCV